MPKRIAVLVTHDFEELQYSEPVQAFRAARHSILNIEKSAGNIIYGQQRKAAVTIDHSIDDVGIDDFDALLIPGGNSAQYLSEDARFVHFVRHFAQAEGFAARDGTGGVGVPAGEKTAVPTYLRTRHTNRRRDSAASSFLNN